MRNHGESPHLPKMTYTNMANDIAHFIEYHKLGPCAIIGHSMGGKISMVVALTRPELVERLLVLDIAPVHYDHNYLNYVKAMKNIDLSKVSRRVDVQLIISNVVENPTIKEFLMQNLVTNKKSVYEWRVNLDAFESNMTDILGFPKISSKQAYTAKTLFVGGSKSDYIKVLYQSEIDRLFPNSEINFVDGAGHWAHADKPKAVLEYFRAFLR